MQATVAGHSRTALPLKWLENHGDALYAYALRRVRRREAAEDLVQETLLAALVAQDQFARRADVRTWLIAILKNKISDHLRVRYRRQDENVPTIEDAELFTRRGTWKTAVQPWRSDPSALAERGEFRAVLDGCLSKLPVPMAHLFLSRVGGQPTDELCRELDISAENAWTLLHRARLRLRQCLATRWFGDARGSPAQAGRSGECK